MRKRANKLNIVEQAKASDLVRQFCHRGESGRAVYDEDWGDERIRLEIGPEVSLRSIQRLRKALVGELQSARTAVFASERIEKLEATVSILCTRLGLDETGRDKPLSGF
jgi:hypothetical protein